MPTEQELLQMALRWIEKAPARKPGDVYDRAALIDAIREKTRPRQWVGLTDEEWAALWEDFAWESELTIEEQFQKEMTKKHGKGHYYMGAEEFWNRQKDVIQKLVNAKLKEKNV